MLFLAIVHHYGLKNDNHHEHKTDADGDPWGGRNHESVCFIKFHWLRFPAGD
jgi:hypothetical protein